MRSVALSLWVLCVAAVTPVLYAADGDSFAGKSPGGEAAIIAPVAQGESAETPNQRRQRLGLPIEATFPPQSFGQLVETPNQLKHRLGIAVPVLTPASEVTLSQETPNQERMRLACAPSVL